MITNIIKSHVLSLAACIALLVGTLPQAANTAHAQDSQGDTPVYLPLISGPPGPPAFTIINPNDGLTVSGTGLFAVQIIDPASVASVTFTAGGVDLGTDNTADDGFQVFFDASALPAGPVTFSATATGPTGVQATKSIGVFVDPNPPDSALVRAAGATLATTTGSTIVVPPNAVTTATNVTIADKTQEQVTADEGIDWDGLGVTFLGAIDVQTSGPISKPLGVSSVGFGNRIQPGQAVVTYRILPDADGDGKGEIVVVNGANLAPNGTIVSSPVAGVVVNALRIETAGVVQAAQGDVLAGPPGALLIMDVNGFNPLSSVGNLAIFQSQVDGTTLSVPGIVEATSTGGQTFQVLLPPLPAGDATLTLKNQSTSETVGPFTVTILAPAALSQPAADLVDDFFSQSIATVQGLSDLTPQQASQRPVILARLTDLRTQFQQLAADPAPESQQMVEQFAIVIDGSGALVALAAAQAEANASALQCITPHQRNVLNLITGLGVIAGSLGCALALTGVGAAVCAAGFATAGLIDGYLIAEAPDCAPPPPACTPAPASSGGGTTGMGSAPPPGGNGCGNASGGGNTLQAAAGQQFENGRYTVRIFPQAGGAALTPFTGATDPGGYFFLPLIPQGEPFRARALDNLTGATVTVDGVGPATGKSVYMFFDFAGAQSNLYPIQIGDTISDGVPSEGAGNIEIAGGLDIYTFDATPGQRIFVDLLAHDSALNQVDWWIEDSAGTEIFRNCLGCGQPGVQTLTLGGRYTLRVGDDSNPGTGIYSFKLWDVPAPDTFAINIGDTISNSVPGPGAGNIETPGVKDIYRFNAAAGQQVFVDLLSRDPTTAQIDWALTDNSGAQIFRTCLGCGQPGVQTLTLGGAYTLTVGDNRVNAVGAYSFKVWDVPAPDEFTIAIDDTISNSVPGPGAGNIETAGVKDIYRFNAAAGQEVFVDLLSSDPATAQIDWALTDSSGAQLFRTCLGCGQPGVQTLTLGGVYTLTVGDDRVETVGAYSFKIWAIPAPDEFTIAIGDTISNSVPGPGAGNIETPGVKDIYTFNATAGQEVSVDLLNRDPATAQIDWVLTDSSGAQVFRTCLGCGQPGLQTLTLGGVYTLTVGDDRVDAVGTYSFQLRVP